MLISKINPPAVKSIEITPFSSTTTNLNYMTAIARPYAPGASSTNFQKILTVLMKKLIMILKDLD